jgi:hypothetical protein
MCSFPREIAGTAPDLELKLFPLRGDTMLGIFAFRADTAEFVGMQLVNRPDPKLPGITGTDQWV